MADVGSNTKGFFHTPAAAAYQYDLNGNMTQDNHKGFTFAYNFLNLPQTMTKGASFITMTYTADGEKLSKAVTGGGATKNYVGGIEYAGANLEAIYFGEGRCTPNGATAFNYDYTVKDHLGSARVNFRANGAAITVLESMHYYPFGMLMEGIGTNTPTNDYTYNYKELNEDFGLNLYDYGARWYDASLGRWWSVDPFSQIFRDNSPYAFVANDPINGVDIFGLFRKDVNEKSEDTYMPKFDNNAYMDDHYYDPNGNLVVVIPNDDPDKYYDVVDDGRGHWFVTGERSGPPNRNSSPVYSNHWESVNSYMNYADVFEFSASAYLGAALTDRLKYVSGYKGQPASDWLKGVGKTKLPLPSPLASKYVSTKAVYGLSKTLKIAGRTLGGLGVIMSTTEAVTGYLNGDRNTMNKGIAGTIVGGLTVIGIGVLGGPVVAAGSILYFTVIEPIIFESDKN
jgi:RHS repeat-associated protein